MELTAEERTYLKDVLEMHREGLNDAYEKQIEDGSLGMTELLEIAASNQHQVELIASIKEKING